MRICICGLGKVGLPMYHFFLSRYCVYGYDTNPDKSISEYPNCAYVSDATVFIVPTPSNPDGSFSNEYLEAALIRFKQAASEDHLYIIGSTVTPGSCATFKDIVGPNVVYKPEFIRLASVAQDMENPSFILIGADNYKAGSKCEEIYRRLLPATPIKRMSLMEAELTKIGLNCALTMKISMANQMALVAERLGADPNVIMEAIGSDPRIGPHYLKPGAPFGGPCLPRDNRMFQYVAKQVGVDAVLSHAVDTINEMPEIASRAEIL